MQTTQNKNITPEREAIIFGRYLLGKRLTVVPVRLYVKAMKQFQLQHDEKELRLMSFINRFPFFIGMIDGGLALTNKNSCIRKKILTLLAITETMPEYSKYFLPQKFSIFSVFYLLWTALRAFYRAVLGYVLVKLI